MAATKANIAKYPGGRDVWGGHGVLIVNYTGPSAYANPGGDEFDAIGAAASAQTGVRNIDMLNGGVMTVSGTYIIYFQPSAVGPTGIWYARWFVTATMAEVANGVNLSAEKAIITIVGG